MPEKVIEFKNIAKKYCFSSAKQSLISTFLLFFKKVQNKIEVWALKDINFSVEKGEIIGIIGENASGKTTILRIISGITVPSSGNLTVKGKVAGLLDLGAGFHPELTGRENIYLDAALYGLNRQETDAVFDEILKFSGLEAAIDSQVKTYSQGMLVRLGFSVAVHVDPDIFLIDDSLAVGDAEFQRKCLAQISAMNKQGITVVIVSHDLDSLSRIADRGILLKNGQMVKDDSIDKSIFRYVQAVGEKNSIACIDQGKLSVIFNNGKIVLLWDGKPITCDFGGYLSVKVLDKWLMSWQFNWQTVKTEKNFFLMQGKWPNSELSAEIQVKVRSESEFECIGKINFGNKLKADKAVFGFMFNHKYCQYLDGDKLKQIQEQENFADQQWQDLYRTDQSDALLVLGASDLIPAVWANFAIEDLNGFGLIQTKGKSFDASVIQMQVLLAEVLNVSCKAVIKLLDKKELDQKLKEQAEKVIISKHNLSLKLEQKYAHLFIGQQQITKAGGLRFGFEYQNHFYNLFDGQWKIRKNSGSEFLIDSDFIAQGIVAKLNLSLQDNEFSIDLKLENRLEQELPKLLIHMDVDLIPEYLSYFSLNQENDFLAATEFEEKIELKDIRCNFIGFKPHQEQPSIVLISQGNAQIALYNACQEISSRHVQLVNQELNCLSASIRVFERNNQKQDFILTQNEKFNHKNILANDVLNIDCSQDRIRVFFGKQEVTALDGFTSGMFLNKRWYESHAVAKNIEKTEDGLLITLQRKFPELTEYWQFKLNKQSIDWQVYLSGLASNNDFEYKAGIMLSPEFSQWINAYESARFSQDQSEMQIIELQETNSQVLGASTDAPGCAVLFKSNNLAKQRYVPLLQQSNWTRVLQFVSKISAKELCIEKKLIFSGTLKLMNKAVWQKDLAEYCQKEFSLVAADSWQLTAKQQKTELYSLGQLISADCGLAVSISAYDEFDSFRGQWDIQKLEQNTLSIYITYRDSPFALKWFFRAKDGDISWTVEIEVFEPIEIDAIQINLFLPKEFKHWQSADDKGIIELDNKSRKIKPINLIDNRSQYMIFKQEDLAGKQSAAIGFGALVDMQQWLVQMYKPQNKDIIALELKHLLGQEKLCFNPGKHEIFKANLGVFSESESLNNFKQNMLEKVASPAYSISKGEFNLVWQKAKIRLFYKGRELTHGLGIYTGIKILEQWSDSSQAIWQVQSASDNLQAQLYSNHLPKQTQKIEWVNDDELLWQICFELESKNIEQIAVGIMLSQEFANWQTADFEPRSGVFAPKDKSDVWQQVAVTSKRIAIDGKSRQLPQVALESVCNIAWENSIEDTDINHNSRVLVVKTKNILVQDKKIEFKIKLKIDN